MSWEKFSKIVFRIILVFIAFCIIIPIIGDYFSLEISNDSLKVVLSSIKFFGVPLAVLLTLVKTIKNVDTVLVKVLKVVFTSFIALISIFYLLVSAFELCNRTTLETLFVNKENENITIVVREFGCGAVDSTPANRDNYKNWKINDYLIRSTPIDTSEIDKTMWVKYIPVNQSN